MKYNAIMMKKLTLFLLVFFFLSCHSCYMDKTEALNFIHPIIQSIQNYKQSTNCFPNDLTQIKNFPYKIKKYPNKNAYYFLNRKSLYMQIDFITKDRFYLKVDFLQCQQANSIRSVGIDFQKDKYTINYFKISPAFKQ